MNIKKQAKRYRRQIMEYCAAVNLKMELEFDRVTGDLFIFRIIFIPGTNENKIRQHLEDIKQTLELQLLMLHREHGGLFFVASENNTFDNRLLGILTSPSFEEYVKNMQIPYAIGFNAMRRPVVIDLPDYIHMLLGGMGNSGKTTAMQCFIVCILMSCSPERVNIVIIDESANLMQFSELPHLSCPVIQYVEIGYRAVMKLHGEMKRRLKLKGENPDEFKLQPTIVCFIDECVSFVAGVGSKQKSQALADAISLLLRMGRHAGIYLVLATQNPSLDEMKCDLSPLTTRIAFACGKPQNSVALLGEGGAESLSGSGELYFKSQKHSGLMFIKGANVTAYEIETVCNYVRSKYEGTLWDDSYRFTISAATLQSDKEDAGDSLIANPEKTTADICDEQLAKIIMWALERETVSGNAIHKAFTLGERKAGRILEKMHELGIVGDANAKLGRIVLPQCIEDISEETLDFLLSSNISTSEIGKVMNPKKSE